MACCATSAVLVAEAPTSPPPPSEPPPSPGSSPSRKDLRSAWLEAAALSPSEPLMNSAPRTPASETPLKVSAASAGSPHKEAVAVPPGAAGLTKVTTASAGSPHKEAVAVPPDAASLVAALITAGLNGVWKLDKAASEPMAPLMTALGAPWFVVKAMGEVVPTWRLSLTETGGAVSFEHLTETNGRKTANTYKLGATTDITGMEPGKTYPGTMELTQDGSLCTAVKRSDSTYCCTIDRPFQSGKLRVLLALNDESGKTIASARRVFTRAAA